MLGPMCYARSTLSLSLPCAESAPRRHTHSLQAPRRFIAGTLGWHNGLCRAHKIKPCMQAGLLYGDVMMTHTHIHTRTCTGTRVSSFKSLFFCPTTPESPLGKGPDGLSVAGCMYGSGINSLSWPGRGFFGRLAKNTTNPTISARTTAPPTAAPTMTPVLTLLDCDSGVGVVVGGVVVYGLGLGLGLGLGKAGGLRVVMGLGLGWGLGTASGGGGLAVGDGMGDGTGDGSTGLGTTAASRQTLQTMLLRDVLCTR